MVALRDGDTGLFCAEVLASLGIGSAAGFSCWISLSSPAFIL